MSILYRGDYLAGEIEIIRENPIFANQYLSIYNDEVLFPSGTTGTYLRVSSADNLSIGVLPVSPEGKLILIRNFRHGVRGWGYEMPKGEILSRENPEMAVARELMEETGLTFKRLVFLGRYSESPAIFSSQMICYAALDCISLHEATPEPTEAISGLHTFEPEEYLTGQTALDYQDSLTELAVLKFLRIKGEK